jgi:putative sigma-54 modulation protein
MEILVRNAEGRVSARNRDYVAEKIGRLDRYFNSAQKAEVVHREDRGMHKLQITVFANGHFVRSEEKDPNFKAAVDKITDKLHTRLSKLKERIVQSHRRKGPGDQFTMLEVMPKESAPKKQVKEHKHFLVKPMSAQEAITQMEEMQSQFFLFRDEISNEMLVMYKRKDGHFGLMKPEG